jgi:hypothetical protein
MMKRMASYLSNGVDSSVFITWLVSGMYEGNSIMTRKQQMIKGGGLKREQIDLAQNMRLVRGTFLNLEPKYI